MKLNDKRVLEYDIDKGYIIYLDEVGTIKMQSFDSTRLIKKHDGSVDLLEGETLSIRKEILEYLLMKYIDMITFEENYVYIYDNDKPILRVNYNHDDAQCQYKPKLDSWIYLCVQPQTNYSPFEIELPIGFVMIDNTTILAYAKIMFLIEGIKRGFSRGDRYMRSQFRNSVYNKYLGRKR